MSADRTPGNSEAQGKAPFLDGIAKPARPFGYAREELHSGTKSSPEWLPINGIPTASPTAQADQKESASGESPLERSGEAILLPSPGDTKPELVKRWPRLSSIFMRPRSSTNQTSGPAPSEAIPLEMSVVREDDANPRAESLKEWTRRNFVARTAQAGLGAAVIGNFIGRAQRHAERPSAPVEKELQPDLMETTVTRDSQPMERFLYSYLKDKHPDFPRDDPGVMKLLTAVHEVLDKGKESSEPRAVLQYGYINLLAKVFFHPEKYTKFGRNDEIGDWIHAFKYPPQGLSKDQLAIQQQGVAEKITWFITEVHEQRKNKNLIVDEDGTIHNTFSDGKMHVYPSPSSSL